jgi:uncharacterized protein YheU (UPF0270 family)
MEEAVVVIPHRTLSESALRAVIEEFVTREGTDYGLYEHTLAQKHDAIARKLEAGEVFIVFDGTTESVSVLTREELPADVRASLSTNT